MRAGADWRDRGAALTSKRKSSSLAGKKKILFASRSFLFVAEVLALAFVSPPVASITANSDPLAPPITRLFMRPQFIPPLLIGAHSSRCLLMTAPNVRCTPSLVPSSHQAHCLSVHALLPPRLYGASSNHILSATFTASPHFLLTQSTHSRCGSYHRVYYRAYRRSYRHAPLAKPLHLSVCLSCHAPPRTVHLVCYLPPRPALSAARTAVLVVPSLFMCLFVIWRSCKRHILDNAVWASRFRCLRRRQGRKSH